MRAFTKMHGLGNCYIFMSTFEEELHSPEMLAVTVSDRNRGIGSDGLITVGPARDDSSHVSMHIYNADGSEAEMCGNGIRCACKFVYERGLCKANPMTFSTPAGHRRVWYEPDKENLIQEVEVEMGVPQFGVDAVHINDASVQIQPDGMVRLLDPLTSEPYPHLPNLSLVSVGNPHAILFVQDLDSFDMTSAGPLIENHPAFPDRINAHAVELPRGTSEIPAPLRMVTWERGSGLTQACGTGAAAVCAAVVEYGAPPGSMRIALPGGLLALRWPGGDADILLRGEAVEVCTGTLLQGHSGHIDGTTLSSTHFA